MSYHPNKIPDAPNAHLLTDARCLSVLSQQLTLNQRVAGSQRNAMKLTLKDLVKLIAPYLVAIGGAIWV